MARKSASTGHKKPFYKKWWVIAIAAIVVISAIGDSDDNSSDDVSASSNIQTRVESSSTSTSTESQESEDASAESDVLISEQDQVTQEPKLVQASSPIISLNSIQPYTGNAYISVNDNNPYFTDSEKEQTIAFETYSDLDSLGRCGVAYANICKEIMPTEERGEIGQVKPSGWHTVKYDCVDGKYLYNRCHLIGFQLAGENANEKNLITGTRYLNIDGMLPFENMVDDYVDETSNHVLYRVTPIFEGSNLVADGVLMEGYSVEDSGDGICFCVFAYNVQPGVAIDYATGDSSENQTDSSNQPEAPAQTTQPETQTPAEQTPTVTQSQPAQTENKNTTVYITKSGTKYHCDGCSSLSKSKIEISLIEAKTKGYEPCSKCNPPS